VIASLPAGVLDDALARPRRRLIGMGSSRFAALDAAARWRLAGQDAIAETASASGPSRGGADTLAIVISSSGSTAEAVAAAKRHRAEGSLVLAMTSWPASALAAEADIVLPLRAERSEASGIATLSYHATVAGLLALDGNPAIETELDAAPAAIADVIASRQSWLSAAADVLDTGREIYVLADGFQAGTAEQVALMFREASRIAALPFDTGDWLHVGLYTLFPGDAVLLIAGAPADAEAISAIHARGGRAVVVGPALEGGDIAIPAGSGAAGSGAAGSWAAGALAATVVGEQLGAELWGRAGNDASADRRRSGPP
jgi:glucosamine--fructose-6-phosphate aminotransferase (isomerizing)